MRRGLAGEIILKAYIFFNIAPYRAILATSFFAYLMLAGFFAKSFIKKGYSLTVLPFVFFLGGPIINDFWVRKDVLVILFFIAAIHCSTKKIRGQLLLMNLLFMVALLMHESIGFFGLPITMLILSAHSKIDGVRNSLKSVFFSGLKLFPAIVTFFACLFYKGSMNISSMICRSWENISFPIQSGDHNVVPAAIEGLSFSLKQGLSFSLRTLENFNDGFYAPLVWIIIILSIYFFLSNFSKIKTMRRRACADSCVREGISSILVYQLMATAPLFILGWDYGRWIFLWTASSFSVLVIMPDKTLPMLFPEFIKRISVKLNSAWDYFFPQSVSMIYAMPILIGVPLCGWSLVSYCDTMPVVIVLRLISGGIYEIISKY